MAEGVLYDMVGNLQWALGSQVFEEIKLAHGVKDDIRKLRDTVETIQAVLLDAEEKHSQKNHQVTLWLRKLKDAVYDADDLLDDFLTEVKLREGITGNRMARKVRIFSSKSNQPTYGLNIAHKIKTIRKRLDAIKNDRHFHLDEKLVKNIQREQTHSFVCAEEVIGRDNDKYAIIQRLLNSNDDIENVSVLPIVGIGGLGKTTLAQLVYNDEKVVNYFQLKMWLCVSDDFNVKKIVENIIKSTSNNVIKEGLDMDKLQEHLREEISGKKYLLVLDDLWNENLDKWLKLKTLLMNNMKGSKILVTTRSQQVAKVISKHSPYILRGLSENDSWSLFMQMAFENRIEPKSSNLLRIGKCILAKCFGVPLAIRTMGRLLYYNNTEAYWLNFMENELPQMSQEDADILPKLKLSYDHLPSHLKQCFAYCALFPKDYVIGKELLINLWMAQRFLDSSNTNQSLEDVGNEYFMNLVSRSFLQGVKYDKRHHTTTCKIHDLMHDLATLVAGSECTIAKCATKNVQERVRHISFDSQLDLHLKIPNALLRAKHVRTLLLLVQSHSLFIDSKIEKFVSNFRFLCALDMRALNGFSRLGISIESIDKLKHLRYLNISHHQYIIELPSSITRLNNLQTLVLDGCKYLRKLPRDMGNLVNLRCLSMNDCWSLTGMPRKLGLLTNLRTLTMFVLDWKDGKTGELDELGEMNYLSGKLVIRGLEYAKSKSTSANLKAKQYLECLVLKFSKNDFMAPPDVFISDVPKSTLPSDGRNHEELLEGLQPHQHLKELHVRLFRGLSIPSWLSSQANLTSIELYKCEQCRYIPRLDQLPCLEKLDLSHFCALEYISETGSNDPSSMFSTSFFPFLVELRIENCPNLNGWWRIDDGATTETTELPSFSCLSSLIIIDCPKMSSMPLYPSLEKLYLRNTSIKPLQQTMMLMHSVAPSTSSTSTAPLSKLYSLSIKDCHKLELFTNEFDKQWEGLMSLKFIRLSRIPELVCLPEGLLHVTSLRRLWIFRCTNLMDLPEGMQLQELKIKCCPQLLKRYRNNMGVEWQKIAHIPNINFDNQWIQEEGRYQLNSEGCFSVLRDVSTSDVQELIDDFIDLLCN